MIGHVARFLTPLLLALLLLPAVPAGPTAAANTTTAAFAWGNNREYELGDPLAGSIAQRGLPTAASGVARAEVAAIAAGRRHTLLIRSDGTVWAWGDGSAGQLGNGDMVASAVPVQSGGIAGAVGVSGGSGHSLAVTGDGAVWAWGDNTYGQAGNGATGGLVTPPIPVSGLPAIRAVAAGDLHSLALAKDGTVWAWGSNTWNALGNDGAAKQGSPSRVAGLGGVVAIAAGGSVSMALKGDGTVWVWGSDTSQQLGDGGASEDYVGHPAPQRVPDLGGVVAIAAAYAHLHALKGDGTVWGWGGNGEAELGLGYVSTGYCGCVATPTRTPGVGGVTAIAAGDFHTLALNADGTVLAWGRDAEDQTNEATGVNGANQPVALGAVRVRGLDNVAAIAGGGLHSIALRRVTVPAFADVPPGHWAAGPIGQFAQRGITTGCDAGLFCPERGVTRAEMAVFLDRTLGYPNPAAPATPTFADVPANYWAYAFIEQFVTLGLTTGCAADPQGARAFCPERGVTRAEMAAFLIRARKQAQPGPAAPTFADVPTTHPQYGYIEALVGLGITTGCGADDQGRRLYCPDRGVTRAEMAVFITRAYP